MDKTDIRSQTLPEFIVIGDPEMLQKGCMYLRGCVVIAGRHIRLLKSKGRLDSFSGLHSPLLVVIVVDQREYANRILSATT